MAFDYETDPFRVLRAALSELCENAIYAETDGNPHRACPDYLAELRATSRAISAAESVVELAAVPWVTRKAALGAESMDSVLD